MSSSPSDSHAVENADKQIRRSLASHGIEYQTMSEIKRNKNKQKDEPAVEPE
jgi:type IV pilus biogenesis protein CpaD/CtpE